MLSQLRTTWGLVAVGLVGLALLFAVGLLLVRPRENVNRNHPSGAEPQNEDELDQAREILAKAPDNRACRSALQQLNVHLDQQPQLRPEPLSEEQRRLLLDPAQLGLDRDEMAEVENPNFTLLDDHYLELCFLLSDAARSLELRGLSEPEQAAAAFAWVMRQVRLVSRDEELLAPEFILHRGWGTARQRALVFASLLAQLGIPGCVLAPPGGDGGSLDLWACGALVKVPGGTQDVLLFDPRLGLPLPGGKAAAPELARAFRLALPVPVPGDVQPASLAALRRQPDLLKALATDDRHSYDVTAERVGRSRVYAVALLSALAPRLKYLQEELPAARADVRLTADPAAVLAAWQEACRLPGGPAPRVSFWKEAARAQLAFWPPELGGNDKSGIYGRKLREVIPSYALPQFKDLEGAPNQRLRDRFLETCAILVPEPGMPADLMQHGRFDEAAQVLVQVRDKVRERKARLAAAVDLGTKIQEWSGKILEAQANYNVAAEAAPRDPSARAALGPAKAQLDQAWKEAEDSIMILVDGRAAEVQLPEVTYVLALCKQEQAERLQMALDRDRARGQEVNPDDVKAAQEAWADAGSWWDLYGDDLGTAASGPAPAPHRGSAPAARLLHARAGQALGETDAARRLLEDVSGDLTALEQTARLYLARRLRKP
jgi:hypothetical protein